jgi:lipopolysaccharide export system permease protein
VKIIDIYIGLRVLGAIGIAVLTIGSMIGLIDFVDVSRNVGARADVSFTDLLLLTLLKIPSSLVSLLPFMILFGTMGGYAGLNRRSELVALRAAGLSAWRFTAPAGVVALVLGAVVAVAISPLTALAAGKYDELEAQVLSGQKGAISSPIWLRQSDGNTDVILRAGSQSQQQGALKLSDVSVFVYNRQADDRLVFTRSIEAKSAWLEAGYWKLRDVRESAPGTGAIRSEGLSLPSTLDSRSAMDRLTKYPAVPVWRIPAMIGLSDRSGVSSLGLQIRLQQLLATPLLYLGIAVLAAAFSLRLVRRGGVALMSTFGILLGFAFFFVSQVSVALGRAESLPPLIAAWSPPLLALFCGLSLLAYSEDG